MIYIYNVGMFYGLQQDEEPTVFGKEVKPLATYSEKNWFENDGVLRQVGDTIVLGKPSEQDIKNNEAYYALRNKIGEEQQFLSDTDYVCFEIIEGAAKKEDKQKVLDKRIATRDQMTADKEELSKMKLVDLGQEITVAWIDNNGNQRQPPQPVKDVK